MKDKYAKCEQMPSAKSQVKRKGKMKMTAPERVEMSKKMSEK